MSTVECGLVGAVLALLASCGGGAGSESNDAIEADGAADEPVVGFVLELPAGVTVVEDVAFPMGVRAVTASGEVASEYRGTVTLSSDWGDLNVDTVELDAGRATVLARFNREGAATVELTDGVVASTATVDVAPPQWTRQPRNEPVFGPPEVLSDNPAWYSGGIHGPHVVADADGTLWMYFTTPPPKGTAPPKDAVLGRARASDAQGMAWVVEPNAPVWKPSDAGAIGLSDPGVALAPDGTWHLWVTAWREGEPPFIAHATSNDGVTWSRAACLDLHPEDGPLWLAGGVAAPSAVWLDDGRVRLWFSAREGQKVADAAPRRIGTAVGSCEAGWSELRIALETRYDEGPPAAIEYDGVEDPGVWRDGSVWKMLYVGVAKSGAISMNYATSSDGVQWVRSAGNPLLRAAQAQSPTAGQWDARGVRAASVVRLGGAFVLFFEGLPPNGYSRVGRAQQ